MGDPGERAEEIKDHSEGKDMTKEDERDLARRADYLWEKHYWGAN